jgi:hypothetical protein
MATAFISLFGKDGILAAAPVFMLISAPLPFPGTAKTLLVDYSLVNGCYNEKKDC